MQAIISAKYQQAIDYDASMTFFREAISLSASNVGLFFFQIVLPNGKV